MENYLFFGYAAYKEAAVILHADKAPEVINKKAAGYTWEMIPEVVFRQDQLEAIREQGRVIEMQSKGQFIMILKQFPSDKEAHEYLQQLKENCCYTMDLYNQEPIAALP